MSWIGKLFATDKAVDSLLDKDKGLLVRAGGWIDGLSHTDQEKAEDKLLVKQWGIRQLEALAPFKVVQRVIAFAVSGFWILVGLNVLVAIWIEGLNPCEEETVCMNVSQPLLDFAFSDYVFWPVMIVFGLYFAGGVIPSRGAVRS